MMTPLITVGHLEARLISDEAGTQRLEVRDGEGGRLASFYGPERAVHAYQFMVAVQRSQLVEREAGR